jgi:hypothetical protein
MKTIAKYLFTSIFIVFLTNCSTDETETNPSQEIPDEENPTTDRYKLSFQYIPWQ